MKTIRGILKILEHTSFILKSKLNPDRNKKYQPTNKDTGQNEQKMSKTKSL